MTEDAEGLHQLRRFLRLYREAPKIHQLRSDLKNEEATAFRHATGLPPALASTAQHVLLLPTDPSLQPFFDDAPGFWLVPCTVPGGAVAGFVLRSFFGKAYRKFQLKDAPPLMWGLHTLDGIVRDAPVVLAEGVKDAVFLNRFYPHVLAVLTNRLSDFQADFLKRLTRRWVVAFDRDAAGREAADKMRKRFGGRSVYLDRLVPPVKDWGMCFGNEAYERYTRRELTRSIRKLGGSVP